MANTPAKVEQNELQKIVTPETVNEIAGTLEAQLIDKDTKHILAEGQTPFYIKDCTLTEGEYTSEQNPQGNYWLLDIESNGKEYILMMGWHPLHTKKYEVIAELTKEENAKVGPYILQEIKRKTKPSFYKLESAQVLEGNRGELLPF